VAVPLMTIKIIYKAMIDGLRLITITNAYRSGSVFLSI
jgi:hypothetical protein